MTEFERFVFTFFNREVMLRYLPDIVAGFWLTCLLAVAILATGILAGLALAVIRALGLRPVNVLIVVVVDVMRAVPPLVIIVLLYFGLPGAGMSIGSFAATWLALSLVLMAFAEEIFWAGLLSIHRGQWEAARSTGLTFAQTLAHVVLPQAVRMAIAPLTNRAIAVTKGTALGSVVALQEILGAAQTGYSFSANPSPLTLGAIAYIVLFFPVVVGARWIETRFAWKR
ncbi:MAG: amino acid ABC transporter permease [Alphaproteobacteria bacterium]|nr:amino acid ABC transporter permease [Alphaproteobacteria bacterium]